MVEKRLNAAKYRYTHIHEGIKVLAPEFSANDDGDAIAYVKILKDISPDKPLVVCHCGGDKLERLQSGSRNGNLIEFQKWIEVELTEKPLRGR